MANTNNVETIMRNAIDSATSREHEYVTLEHIVLSLLDDPEILMICDQLEVDVSIIIQDIENYLNNEWKNN